MSKSMWTPSHHTLDIPDFVPPFAVMCGDEACGDEFLYPQNCCSLSFVFRNHLSKLLETVVFEISSF